MKLLCLAYLLASASAFTSSPAAFTTQSQNVGQRNNDGVFSESNVHRNRHATIVMDGKANGEFDLHTRPDVIMKLNMSLRSGFKIWNQPN